MRILPVTSTNSAETVNDMKQYRKKPVTIEAVQFDGLNPTEMMDFAGENCEVEIYDNQVTPPIASIVIHTLEGDMKVSNGDYIIKGVKGEFYPCKPDIFEQTYESAKTQKQPKVDLEKEVASYFEGFWPGMETVEQCNTKMSFTPTAVMRLARHFYELGLNARKSIWHNVSEETPTSYGEEVIVACRNKNKEDGIWLYDLIQCWEGKWEPRVNWETPVKWAYVKDLDIEARKEE